MQYRSIPGRGGMLFTIFTMAIGNATEDLQLCSPLSNSSNSLLSSSNAMDGLAIP